MAVSRDLSQRKHLCRLVRLHLDAEVCGEHHRHRLECVVTILLSPIAVDEFFRLCDHLVSDLFFHLIFSYKNFLDYNYKPLKGICSFCSCLQMTTNDYKNYRFQRLSVCFHLICAFVVYPTIPSLATIHKNPSFRAIYPDFTIDLTAPE